MEEVILTKIFFIDLTFFALYLLFCYCDMDLGSACYTQPRRLRSPRIARLCVRLRLLHLGLE